MSNSTIVVGKGGSQGFKLLRYRLAVLYCRCTINTLAHLLNLVLQTISLLIGEADGKGVLLVDSIYHLLCQLHSTLTTFQKSLVDSKSHA